LTRNDRLRVAAALAASLLAHVALLSFLRLPPEQPPLPAGSRLNLLLIPVPGERRAESVSSASSLPAAPTAAEAARLRAQQRKAGAAAPAPQAEQRRQRQPWVSASPMSVPQAQPESLLTDARDYLPPDAVTLHPQFATPFAMSYPRRAFEEGRRAVVVVQVMIDESGRVIEAIATADAPEDFAQAAVAALRLARFTPAQAGGGPVKARAYFAVSFVIE